MDQKPFFLCVDGIYHKAGKVLLLKRQVAPFKDCWSFVGGHVEDNETVQAALKREFQEETNLTVTVGSLLGCRVEETFDRMKIILTFEITNSSGQITLNEENQEYGWFNEIPKNSVFNHSAFTLLSENLIKKLNLTT